MFLERLQFKYRLCISHLFLLATLFVGVGFGVFYAVKFFINSTVDESLIALSHSIRENHLGQYESPLELFTREFKGILGGGADDFLGVNLDGRYAQIITIKGDVHSRSKNFEIHIPVTGQSLSRAEKGLETLETFRVSGMPSLRQITIPVMLRGMFTGQVIQVGASMEKNERLLESVLLVLWTVLPIGAFVASLIVYFMAMSALTPVSVMTKAASSLEVQNLSGRIPVPKAKDQLSELAITFNHLIDRIQDSVLKLRRFTGDVSHELRTPLAVIKGEAEFALRKPRTPEEYQKTLEIIRRESGSMAKIIEELLLLARVEGHAVKMNWGQVSTPAFIRQLQEDAKSLAHEKQVSVVSDVKPGALEFEAAEGYLLLAVRNILFNAVKHSPVGGEVVMRFDKAYSRNTHSTNFMITLSDKGGGIPEQDIPFIFDPFYRVDSARNRSVGGSGIGLSLAMALIKMHEGKVEVESQLGIGSHFKITIPQSNALSRKNESIEAMQLKEGLQT